MNVFFALVLINSLCEFLHGNFSVTFPEVKISSSRLAGAFPEVGISSSRLAGTFPEVGITSSRLAGAFPEVGISSPGLVGAFPEVGITLSRSNNIFPEVGITLSGSNNIFPEVGITSSRLVGSFPEVGLAFRRIGRLILRSKEHANNLNKMENDGIFSFNNDIEYNFLIIQNENVIRGLVLRNRNRQSGFYNNFLINQNF